jgi:prephenate dehydrogenase
VNAFTRHLLEKGHNIRLYDIDSSKSRALAEKYDCQWLNTLTSTVSGVDMALLCTPIRETPGIIRAIASNMRHGSILCEVSSLKMRTVAALKKHGDHVRPLSIHPMFGPDISTLQGQTVVVVPVSDREKEATLAESLFGDVNIVVADAETHDRVMASVLALPYFMNLAFASTLSTEDLSLMRKMAGTTFTVQLAVTQSIVGESPELIESLINEDMFSIDLVNRFIDESRHLRRLLKKGPRAMRSLCDRLREHMMNDVEYIDARRVRNDFLRSMRNQAPAVEKRPRRSR